MWCRILKIATRPGTSPRRAPRQPPVATPPPPPPPPRTRTTRTSRTRLLRSRKGLPRRCPDKDRSSAPSCPSKMPRENFCAHCLLRFRIGNMTTFCNDMYVLIKACNKHCAPPFHSLNPGQISNFSSTRSDCLHSEHQKRGITNPLSFNSTANACWKLQSLHLI